MRTKRLSCPHCGSPDVIETFCASCLRLLSPLVVGVKPAKLTLCTKSGAVKLRSWERVPLPDAIRSAIQRALLFERTATIVSVRTMPDLEQVTGLLNKPGVRRTLLIPTLVRGRRKKGGLIEEEYEIPLEIETTVSPQFAKHGTNYFEATLQVRNERPVHQRAFRELVKTYARTGFAITKEVPEERGTDYFVTSNKIARKIAHELHTRFGGLLRTNAKLFSHDKQTSKDLFRMTFYIEYPPYEVGDVVTDGSAAYLVRQLGRRERLEDLSTGKVREGSYSPGKYEILPSFETEVLRVYPTLTVLHPETFQEREVERGDELRMKFRSGERVRVVLLGARVWVLPREHALSRDDMGAPQQRRRHQ